MQVLISCAHCGTEKWSRPCDQKRRQHNFCSRACSARFYGPRSRRNVVVECAYCHVKFERKACEARKAERTKSGLHFCCREHKALASRLDGGIQAIHPPHYGTNYRTIAFSLYPVRCNRCPYEKDERVLQVHHRNHDHSDDRPENLEILCANCHLEEHLPPLVRPDGIEPSSPAFQTGAGTTSAIAA